MIRDRDMIITDGPVISPPHTDAIESPPTITARISSSHEGVPVMPSVVEDGLKTPISANGAVRHDATVLVKVSA